MVSMIFLLSGEVTPVSDTGTVGGKDAKKGKDSKGKGKKDKGKSTTPEPPSDDAEAEDGGKPMGPVLSKITLNAVSVQSLRGK